jgi:hypothetical protein
MIGQRMTTGPCAAVESRVPSPVGKAPATDHALDGPKILSCRLQARKPGQKTL